MLIAASIAVALALSAPAGAVTLPAGFQESTAFSGLDQPMAVEFAGDGRVFVAEKSGRVKVFDNLSDTTPTLFADLRTKVHDYWDRGLEGMTLHPNFPAQPYVYVHYVHDAAIGGTAPRWGDTCPDPPGGTGDGCVVSGRVSRLTANGNVMTGSEQVLVEDWCMQYPSHAGGGMDFGADGYLYVTGGDGAAWHFNDYGQDGNPVNPCGDPPGGPGTALTPPTAEGGRLRAQDMRTTSDPAGLNGSLIRIDPNTGLGVSGNPFFSSSDLKARRIIAYGFRNPFRMTIRPGTSEAWVGDVGNARWEEVDRHTNPNGPAGNYGWPCYEGANRFGSFDSLNLNICENLYAQSGAVTAPYWAYDHNTAIVSGENCPNSGNALAGLAFYPTSGGSFPAAYAGALFFADNSRNCIWALRAGTNGLPDPNQRVDLRAGRELSGGPEGGSRRGPLLRGHRDGGDPAHPRDRSRERRTERACRSRPDVRHAAARGRLRRHGLGGPEHLRHPHLRLGLRRQRHDRLDRGHAHSHLQLRRELHGAADGARPGRPERYRRGRDQGGQHASRRHDRHAEHRHPLEGRRPDRLLGPRHGRPAGHSPRLIPFLVARHAALHHSNLVPLAPDPGLSGRRGWLVQRGGPRVSVSLGAHGHGHRRAAASPTRRRSSSTRRRSS